MNLRPVFPPEFHRICMKKFIKISVKIFRVRKSTVISDACDTLVRSQELAQCLFTADIVENINKSHTCNLLNTSGKVGLAYMDMLRKVSQSNSFRIMLIYKIINAKESIESMIILIINGGCSEEVEVISN